MSSAGFKVAVVGATGAVGRELFRVLEQRKFPVAEILAFASPRSEGKELAFASKAVKCQVLKPSCFRGVDFAFFDAADAISKEWVPQAAESGAWVIDNSATFRMDDDIPLVVPEVNGDVIDRHFPNGTASVSARQRILTGPNCSTAGLVVALKPIQQRWGLKRVVVSTYQSVSGAGSAAMDELRDQTQGVLQGKEAKPVAFAHPIAFNCIPQIGGFKDFGYTSEEEKIILESRKLLGLPHLRITATAVRVPTFQCHGESVNIECEREFDLAEVRAALKAHHGIALLDNPSERVYPMNMSGAGQDPVYVGRVRKDASVDNGLNLWVVSDNLRKGAALNAVQIAETLLRKLRA